VASVSVALEYEVLKRSGLIPEFTPQDVDDVGVTYNMRDFEGADRYGVEVLSLQPLLRRLGDLQ
jgi:hypothetical protein